MASGPPDDGSILPAGWTWGDVGHGALDVAGLVPGYGEAADVANALWYTGEEKYLEAGLSLISTVPIVGDAIGKGGKLVGKLGGPALKKLVPLLKKADFAAALAPFRKNKKLAPHIDKMIAALEKWRDELIDKATGCKSCKAKLAKAADPTVAMIGKTPVPLRILDALTPVERSAFEKAIREVEAAPLTAARDKAVFYSGKKGREPAWKIVDQLTAHGKADSVNSLTGNLLNKPEYRKVLPDDAMGFIDDLASKKLADNARGAVRFIGDVEQINPKSVFRRIELPALLRNPNISDQTRREFMNMKYFLDARYGKLPGG